jgi:hypothetical protein
MSENPNHPVNSREWWEEYFAENWHARGGSNQTVYCTIFVDSKTRFSRIADELLRASNGGDIYHCRGDSVFRR